LWYLARDILMLDLNYSRKWFCLVVMLLLCTVCEVNAGQELKTSVSVTILDSSGAVIPNAVVTVTDTAKAVSLSSPANQSGRYQVPGLYPGEHSIHVEATGFQAAERQFSIDAGESISFDITLEVAGTVIHVDVPASTPLLNTEDASVSGVVEPEALHALALNGRDLFQLTALQPGVTLINNGGPNPFGDGGTGKAAFGGARPPMNNSTMDGGDINDPGFNNPAGGPSGAQLGVDAIQEFRVFPANYGVENGRNGGAAIQFTSKSGTSRYHGSGYGFHRNGALDARNFFDIGDNPPLIRHQFGGSLGGPIHLGKTFFFANFEGLRENRSVRTSISVPDSNAHLGLLPSAADPTQLFPFGVDSRVRPFLDLYPLPNGPSLGGGLALFNASRTERTHENFVLARVDHILRGGSNMYARYMIDDGHANVPFQSTLVPGFDGRRETRNQQFMLSWLDVHGSGFVNEVKFDFSRVWLSAVPDSSHPISISLLPNRPLGSINIAGLPLLGNNIIFPVESASNTFQFVDNASYIHGTHLFKYGADIKQLDLNGRFDIAANGQYRFVDLSPYGVPSFSNNAPLEFFLRASPALYIGVDPAAGDSNRGYRQHYVGLYVQDNWKIRRNFSIDLGIRWEYSSNPSEVNGRISNIRSLEKDAAPTVGKIWESVPADLFSPRVGFAWSLGTKPSAVIHGGVGIYRDQIWGNLYSNTRFYAPFYRPVLTQGPNFLTPPDTGTLGGGPTPSPGSFGITYRPDFPYYVKYSLSVQKQLASGTVLEAGYFGARGIHLPRAGEANLTPNMGHVNPNFGSLPIIVTDANSVYHSFQLSVLKTMSRNFQVQTSYTLSKSVDDQSGVFPSDWVSESGVSQNFYNRTGDRARSSFDRRHVFTTNFVYNLPGLGPQNTVSALLSNWQASGIWTMMSGLPFTANLGTFNNSLTNAANPADRPDVKSGADPCKTITGRPDQWFDPTIFKLPAQGQYGNAGRNTLCGPYFANIDLSLSKTVHLKKEVYLQIRVEAFNALNRTNFSMPVNTQGAAGFGGNGEAIFTGRQLNGCQPTTDASGCGMFARDAGRIYSTAGNSRQFQVALRLTF